MTLENTEWYLNTGIVIEASPPGKKLQNLLITFRWRKKKITNSDKPTIRNIKSEESSFVVLDEMEAALDEENVNRFAKFL